MGSFDFKRIVVVGATSSGKSTLAKRLAGKFNLAFVELDALHWEPDWKEAPDEVFRARAEEATRSDRWIVAGNYHQVRDIIWPRAEAAIWLDYSLPLILGRLTSRAIRRSLTREELWNGNRENFWRHLKLWSEESLYHWLFKTYWRHKREFPRLFEEPRHSHLTVIRFQSPRQARRLCNLQT